MKSREELLQFFGVEEGKIYIITDVSERFKKECPNNWSYYINREFKIAEDTDKNSTSICIFFKSTPGPRALSFLSNFEYQEVSGPILNEKEKKYLSAVIKPFKKQVLHIMKDNYSCDPEDKAKYEYIRFEYDCPDSYPSWVDFPVFKKGKMYKNMILGKEYTLEELELWHI